MFSEPAEHICTFPLVCHMLKQVTTWRVALYFHFLVDFFANTIEYGWHVTEVANAVANVFHERPMSPYSVRKSFKNNLWHLVGLKNFQKELTLWGPWCCKHFKNAFCVLCVTMSSLTPFESLVLQSLQELSMRSWCCWKSFQNSLWVLSGPLQEFLWVLPWCFDRLQERSMSS